MNDLLPCPFCKSDDVKMDVHINWGWTCFTPICNSCEARGCMTVKYRDAAIERWNKARPAEPQPAVATVPRGIAEGLAEALEEHLRNYLISPVSSGADKALAAYRATVQQEESKP